MATESFASAREELASLGARRQRLDADDKALSADIRKALKRAKRESVPVNEAADLLHIHRTTIYRVYK